MAARGRLGNTRKTLEQRESGIIQAFKRAAQFRRRRGRSSAGRVVQWPKHALCRQAACIKWTLKGSDLCGVRLAAVPGRCRWEFIFGRNTTVTVKLTLVVTLLINP